ncbi:MAG: hypothetical protein IPH63_07940 [Flavobacteriales bacterium]|nr:hypothetical protein [Flavobacteriales bacterium]
MVFRLMVLQVVQTFYGETQFNLGQVGTYSWSGSNGATMDGFVDGGANSPYVLWDNNQPAHPTNPYYLTSGEVGSQVSWSGDHGSVRVFDMPTAVRSFDMARFETAIVATNYQGTGSDTLLGRFTWGWNAGGTQAVHNGISLLSNSTTTFDSIVKHDYPNYELLGP